MNTLLNNMIIVVQVLSALIIVGLVLVQHGKGADMGAAFGSGASGSLFGATGSSNFLSKSTGVAAAVFFSATLALAYLSGGRHATVSGGVLDALPAATEPAPKASTPAATTAPVAEAAPAKPAPVSVPSTSQSNQIPK